ncbi:hypothetical protein IGI04_029649 [Brassica rapa subsp. trilocularis]|uniref:Knottin scorpion toxin-like domain-containing protein n=2 Tax=Brassica TaxID=3705 RepID=A0ABQ7LR84_BRACM|nr:hypothetical protein IGI04_029649 [Brassica rapa subsp. trilocularis]KAH0914159.1 hypothetical protein HID58_028605 [Brassica napus]CAF2218015.1 unnamed protein product [Brassica napus]
MRTLIAFVFTVLFIISDAHRYIPPVHAPGIGIKQTDIVCFPPDPCRHNWNVGCTSHCHDWGYFIGVCTNNECCCER